MIHHNNSTSPEEGGSASDKKKAGAEEDAMKEFALANLQEQNVYGSVLDFVEKQFWR